MDRYLVALPLLFSGLVFAASNESVATVTSREAFSVQGLEVPAHGGATWPVTLGDVIQTRSAGAEVHMKDGTRIFVPPSSKYVVGAYGSPTAASSPSAAAPVSAPTPVQRSVNQMAPGPVAMRILNGGAVVFPASNKSVSATTGSGSTLGPVLNDTTTPPNFTLPNVFALYGGPTYSPLVEALDEALAVQLQGSTVVRLSGAKFYITGVEVQIGNGPLQPATFIVTSTGISVLPGTILPSNPNPPAALVTFAPPPPGGPPSGCSGITSPPKDISPVIIKIPSVC